MKILTRISRIICGLLFIFSGLVKAIDPQGLAYKMQEFFEAWAASGFMKGAMDRVGNYALGFSIAMITLEVLVGVAILLGWQKRLSTWILVLLMLFFTFLTSYVLFSGKIRACGCFGDCIPLTPIQTFTKDIILLILSVLLLINRRYIFPVAKPFINGFYMLLALVATLFLQWDVLRHLPLKDCLPYRKGNNILELRKMPANAIPDKYDYVFVYEKAGIKKSFTKDFPDSTWTFVERRQDLVMAGSNNVPLINDFSFTAEDGSDVTETVLSEPGNYYLFFLKEIPGIVNAWKANLAKLAASRGTKRLYVITAQRKPVEAFLTAENIKPDGVYTCDVTAIKTAARATPTLYLMKGPVVQDKWGWADIGAVSGK